jgi:hypothetical protein
MYRAEIQAYARKCNFRVTTVDSNRKRRRFVSGCDLCRPRLGFIDGKVSDWVEDACQDFNQLVKDVPSRRRKPRSITGYQDECTCRHLFCDGTVHTAELRGNSAVRDAQLQAVKFDGLAGTSAPRALVSARRAVRVAADG